MKNITLIFLPKKQNIIAGGDINGVNLKEGYNGDISARDAGRVGGNMVKKMIEQYERSLSGR